MGVGRASRTAPNIHGVEARRDTDSDRTDLRSMEGPPMSMFSMQVSKLLPFATVASNGYRLSTTRSIACDPITPREQHHAERFRSVPFRSIRNQDESQNPVSIPIINGHKTSTSTHYAAVVRVNDQASRSGQPLQRALVPLRDRCRLASKGGGNQHAERGLRNSRRRKRSATATRPHPVNPTVW